MQELHSRPLRKLDATPLWSRTAPGAVRRWRSIPVLLPVLLVALAGAATARADSVTLTVTAGDIARRQETALPVVEASPVTVTVDNPLSSSIRVDALNLSFRIGARLVDFQYEVTGPSLPVTIGAGGSQSLVFQVTPKTSATLFHGVELGATGTVTDLGSSQQLQVAATGSESWSVTPGASRFLGQLNGWDLERYRKLTENPSAVCSVGTRVFVADASNNRVLIWNSIPTSNQQVPDVVLGQPRFGSGTRNYPGDTPSASTLNYPSGVFSDGTRLFVTDTGNNRVLIWNSIPTTNQAAADVVVGQANFTADNGGTSASTLSEPAGVFSDGTRLFVADEGNSRVLIWTSIPTANQAAANVVLGQPDFTTSNWYTTASDKRLQAPRGVSSDGTRLFVADTYFNRVLIWNSIPTVNQTAANLVLGQPNFTTSTSNSSATASRLRSPNSVQFDGTRLIVGDSGFHRALLWNSLPTTNTQAAEVVLGQPDFTSNSYNNGGISGATLAYPKGICSDGTRLFVADENNNRVLVWNSIPTSNQTAASLVLGQADFTSVSTSETGAVSASTLGSSADGFSTDSTRLFLADTRNHRVLIWNSIPTGNLPAADVVLGQPDFTSNVSNNGGVSASSLNYPHDVFSDGTRLFVADQYNHRVLIWTSIPTVNNQAANRVLGQPNFTSNTYNNGGVSASSLNYPEGVFSDGTRLSVADANNHRVLIWNSMPAANQQPADVVLGQPNFTSNASGSVTASSLYYPSDVFGDGVRLFVSEPYKHRVLIWNCIPSTNQKAADLVVGQPNFTSSTYNNGGLSASSLYSPSNVFSDGTRLFVSDSNNSRVLVWSSIPTSNGQPAAGAIGPTAFNAAGTADEQDIGPSPFSMDYPRGLATSGGKLWVVDPRFTRVSSFELAPDFRASLTLDQGPCDLLYREEQLIVTVQFNAAPSGTPTIAIAGDTSGSGANDMAATAMTQTANPLVWTHTHGIVSGDDGVFGVTLDATDTSGNHLLAQPAGRTFSVDTVPPAVTVTYGKDPSSVGAGTLAITATFTETLATTPTLAIAAPGTANDVNATAMAGSTGATPLTVWTFAATIQGGAGTEGQATVSIAGGQDAAGNPNTAATNSSFAIDATAPTAVLSYSKNPAGVPAGSLTITATFSESLATTPTLAIAAPGTVNDVAATAMTGSGSVWTFAATISAGSGTDGAATVAIAGAQDPGGNSGGAVDNATFVIDNTSPTVALTYSKSTAAVGLGSLTLTATFSESLATTPSLAIAAPGTVNDVAATAMTGSGSVWTFAATIAAGADTDGAATVA
ncbi:MAG: hypothetical protein HYY25_08860, partial [Candidatus Wallbacteria bacterium]|nr:hypothetical protein [Candidatus Wallbacteria bacterium]